MTTNITLKDAIYGRHSVRSYQPDVLDRTTVQQLLDAGVHAPTAVHEEPWQFVVIQDKALLKKLSDKAKHLVITELHEDKSTQGKHLLHTVSDDNFNIFYDAGTLIAIAVKPMGQFVVADAWLAAENILLTAYSLGLGSCVIGFAVSVLNQPDVKRELGIPEAYEVLAPLIVGKPCADTPPSPRKPAEVLVWK